MVGHPMRCGAVMKSKYLGSKAKEPRRITNLVVVPKHEEHGNSSMCPMRHGGKAYVLWHSKMK